MNTGKKKFLVPAVIAAFAMVVAFMGCLTGPGDETYVGSTDAGLCASNLGDTCSPDGMSCADKNTSCQNGHVVANLDPCLDHATCSREAQGTVCETNPGGCTDVLYCTAAKTWTLQFANLNCGGTGGSTGSTTSSTTTTTTTTGTTSGTTSSTTSTSSTTTSSTTTSSTTTSSTTTSSTTTSSGTTSSGTTSSTTTTTTSGTGGTGGGTNPPKLCIAGNTCTPDSTAMFDYCVDVLAPPQIDRCCGGVLIASTLNGTCPAPVDGGTTTSSATTSGTTTTTTGTTSGTTSSSTSSGTTTSTTSTSSTTTSSTTTSSGTTTSTTTSSTTTSSGTGTVIGACSGTLPPPGVLRVCYVADSGYALGKVGPFELQWSAKKPGPGGYSCWDGQPCSTYGDPANLCVDTNPNDSILECDLPLPSGSSVFEFDVAKVTGNIFWWGDESTFAGGGNGATNGHVTLSTSAGSVTYTMVPGYAGIPYWNGAVNNL